MRGISWSPSSMGQPRQKFLIRHYAWIESGVAWPPFGPWREKTEGAELSGRGECQVYSTPLASSKRNRGKIGFARGGLVWRASDRPAGGVLHWS